MYPELHFLFIGDGVDKEKMRIILDEKKYNNMTLLKPIPRENVKDYLSIIDYGLVPLRNNEVYHKVIPSKIFENSKFLMIEPQKSKSDYKSFSQDFNREIIAFNYLEALKKLNHGNN